MAVSSQSPEGRNVKLRPMQRRATAPVPSPEKPLREMPPQVPGQYKRDHLRNAHLPRISQPNATWLLSQCALIWSLVYECSREICSLFHRIGIAYRRRPDLHGVDLGEFFEKTSSGTYRVNRRSHGRNADIERLLAGRPWLTAVDLSLAVEAWSMGAEWCARNYPEQ